jgi:hypothetical protein
MLTRLQTNARPDATGAAGEALAVLRRMPASPATDQALWPRLPQSREWVQTPRSLCCAPPYLLGPTAEREHAQTTPARCAPPSSAGPCHHSAALLAEALPRLRFRRPRTQARATAHRRLFQPRRSAGCVALPPSRPALNAPSRLAASLPSGFSPPPFAPFSDEREASHSQDFCALGPQTVGSTRHHESSNWEIFRR